MLIDQSAPCAAMTGWFCFCMAFHAEIFFMTHGASSAVPCALQPVGLPFPCNSMVLWRIRAMTFFATGFLVMAQTAVGLVFHGFLTVDIFPNLGRIMLNSRAVSVLRNNIFPDRGMAHRTFVQPRLFLFVAIHAERFQRLLRHNAFIRIGVACCARHVGVQMRLMSPQ